jgi:hypothetical protein
MTAIVAFLAGLFLDIAWAQYIRMVSDGRHWQAGLWSVLCAVPSLTGVLIVVADPTMFAFYGSGLFLGTVLGVAWKGGKK